MNEPREQIVHKASSYILRHLAEDITVQEIADHCGVAPRTLQIASQNILGMSPKAWLTRLRLRHARHALLEGNKDEKVTDVAHGSGFAHLGRFSQLYRNEFGEAPSRTLTQARVIARLNQKEMPPEISRRKTARRPSESTSRLFSAADKAKVLVSGLKTLSRQRGDLLHWRKLHELLHDQLGYRRVAIILKRRSDGRPFIFSHCRHGMGDKTFRIDMCRVNDVLASSRGIVHSVLNSGSSRIVGDVWQSPDYAALDPEIRAELCVPFVHRGETIGAINFESEHREPFDVHDLSLANRLAGAALGELKAARIRGSLGLTDCI